MIFFLSPPTGANVYALDLWQHHRFQGPPMQALHCVWCVGATLGPIIVQPFIPSNHQYNISLPEFQNLSSPTTPPYRVEFSYMTIASLVALTAAPFAFVPIKSGFPCGRRANDIQSVKQAPNIDHAAEKWSRIILLLLLFALSALYYSLECTTSNFISAFTVKHLEWDAVDSPTISSVFWAGLGIGRFVNIFVSFALKPVTMLCINFTLIIVSFTILLFVDHSVVCLWVGVAMSGIGMSSTFVCIYLWTSERMVITGVASSVFVVGGAMGCTAFAPLVGMLFDDISPMCLIYVNLSIAIFVFLLFGVVAVFARFKLRSNNSGNMEAKVNGNMVKMAEELPLS